MTEREITDIIYDTLMQNNQHPQLDLTLVVNQEVDNRWGLILFSYEDAEVEVRINVRNRG